MEVNNDIKNYLLEHGGKRWRAYGYDRIYFDGSIVSDKIIQEGFEVPENIRKELRKNKIYYDLKTGKFSGMKDTARAFRESFNPSEEITVNEDGIIEEYTDDEFDY